MKNMSVDTLMKILKEVVVSARNDVEKSPSCETQRMALKSLSFAHRLIDSFLRDNEESF
jgi:hypothetical protein